ncbi:ABC transporter permease [Tundrisphaera lichenicola]|uniref:ABC transporter permease n=1 Tax=Tundrisphaera lichenicola TaxID=2029860 RepID=UPI003EB7D70C
MYKYLLCWRYLKTRYIALASVISVMLGVATMIVVNSVMAGFSEKMRDRLHGVLADVIVESRDFDGFRNSDEVMARIEAVAGDEVVAMAPTMETIAMMKWTFNGHPITRPIQLIGIKPTERAKTGDFAEFLFDAKGKKIPPSFKVPQWVKLNNPAGQMLQEEEDPILRQALAERVQEQSAETGAIVGYAIAHAHINGKDFCLAPPGARIGLVFPQAGDRPKVTYDDALVVGYFKSGMSEYDSNHVYMPLEQLQRMRLLGDGEGNGAVNQVQIKVRDGVDLDALAMKIEGALEELKPGGYFMVSTWEKKQGPLLAAVAVEQSILNILLFFIIAVAGFGILAIFSMIVVEKTRDIGVLKALGASTAGVRGIFLGYGLALGMVGSGVGMVAGLMFVHYINEIEKGLSILTGRKVFDDAIYYFDKIPTLVQPSTVAWIVGGALFIAVAASVWPAQRAARLRPVQALRFE